jgi:predicted nucleotidyltransferase
VIGFLSGSHTYGTPRPDSDVDIVVLTDETMRARLREICDPNESFPTKPGYDKRDGESLRFGKLNLIIVPTLEEYTAWENATNQLKLRASVTRDEAKDLIIKLVEEARGQ